MWIHHTLERKWIPQNFLTEPEQSRLAIQEVQVAGNRKDKIAPRRSGAKSVLVSKLAMFRKTQKVLSGGILVTVRQETFWLERQSQKDQCIFESASLNRLVNSVYRAN